MRRRVALAFLMFLALGAHQAAAQCTVSAAAMNLGSYTGAVITSGTTPITVNCLILTTYNIGLNQGTGAGATTTIREMTGPAGAELSYQLFQNSSLSTNWGNNSGVDTVAGTSTGGNQIYNVYPEVAANQYVIPGTYTDTVTVSVNYTWLFIFTGTVTTSMPVTATVQPNCLISSSNLAFGTYTGSVLNSTSNISVTCTNTTPYNVGLSAGTGSGATDTNRKMTGPGGATLGYAMYSNAAHTSNWGNNVGVSTLAGTGTGAVQSLTVYGQIPAGEWVHQGNYTDTIIATITY